MNILRNSIWVLIISSALFFSFNRVLPSGDEVKKNVNARDEGKHLIQKMKLVLTNKRGRTQTRETMSYRKDFTDSRKTILVYTAPSNVKGTAFMSFDYNEQDKDDDQWLYLPALRKTRRISAANRGDYFLGTDFTYEDIKLGTKLSEEDYTYTNLKTELVESVECYVLEGLPKSEKIASELGYSKVQHWIDFNTWMVRKSKYWDESGNLLKTSHIKGIKQIQGIWTFQELEAENHKTGHKTFITFENSNYETPVDDEVFSEESLIRGVQ